HSVTGECRIHVTILWRQKYSGSIHAFKDSTAAMVFYLHWLTLRLNGWAHRHPRGARCFEYTGALPMTVTEPPHAEYHPRTSSVLHRTGGAQGAGRGYRQWRHHRGADPRRPPGPGHHHLPRAGRAVRHRLGG